MALLKGKEYSFCLQNAWNLTYEELYSNLAKFYCYNCHIKSHVSILMHLQDGMNPLFFFQNRRSDEKVLNWNLLHWNNYYTDNCYFINNCFILTLSLSYTLYTRQLNLQSIIFKNHNCFYYNNFISLDCYFVVII